MPDLLWKPQPESIERSEIARFAGSLRSATGADWQNDYGKLWRFSVGQPEEFWSHFWDWHGILGSKGETVLRDPDQMTGGQFFPDGMLNYAENMLIRADERPAVIAHREEGGRRVLSRAELKEKVLALAGWMKAEGIGPGDRVAAYTPNTPEAIITMLAAASIGAIFSSCSSDFGLGGVRDRFGQIEPVLLMAAEGYRYNGKEIDRRDIIASLTREIPSVRSVLIVPFLDDAPDLSAVPNVTMFDEALAATPADRFEPMPFNHPLYIMYSSGTTGAPKCITHGAGGTLIQHLKEHRLHCNTRAGDVVFYFTTCGWMMWNWLVSALAVEAAVVLYEGNPFYPGPERLWQMAAAEKINLFGTSAKYIDATRKSGYLPAQEVNLDELRVICSTGSPLTTDGFDFVYASIQPEVQLASISGGTDLISCFVLGCPVLPVYAGEIQSRGLGMAVDVWGGDGQSLTGEQGELVCTKPFPSMPIGFWGDTDGSKYRGAYFEHFPGVWRHGDWATLTERGGIIIHGRSDATLNPGGVRIGTAEIYRQVEAFDEILEALVIGQTIEQDGAQDVRVVLFVRMAEGAALTDELTARIKAAVRQGATPRHVPSCILEVADIPRTRSGKITELAVRDVVEGRPVKNTEALSNPEALEYFRNRPELIQP